MRDGRGLGASLTGGMGFPYEHGAPTDSGMLGVGDGHATFWQVSGDDAGVPVLLLHGGPGSGSSDRHRRMFDPKRFRIVQFDQRGCGVSTPHAGQPIVDLSTNTTPHLIADIELLRAHLGIERWVVWGGSWGSTLGLAYALAHPGAVRALLLSSVVTTTDAEVEWITRGMGRLLPERWQRFVEVVPLSQREGNLARAYSELLLDPRPEVHEPAATAWCQWEDAHVSMAAGFEPRLSLREPSFRLCFARLVTHYWANAAFLRDRDLIDEAAGLAGTPVHLAHGRRDISSPPDVAVALAERIPGSQLFLAETEGHGGVEMATWISRCADTHVTHAF